MSPVQWGTTSSNSSRPLRASASCPKSRSKIRNAFLLLLALAQLAGAQERSVRIRDFDALYTVNTDGSVDVTEKLTIGFIGQWNGIDREIALRQRTSRDRPFKLDVDIVSVTDAGGQPIQRVEQSRKDGGWTRALRIWIPGANDADRQIIIRYRVANPLRWYAAGSESAAFDEFYWNVTGVSWRNPIDKVHARVVLPAGVAPTLTAVYTGAADSRAKDARIDRNGDVVDFTMLRGLNPYEGMTIGVGWPAGSITSRPSEAREDVAAVTQWTPLMIPFIVFFLVFKYWQKRGRDPKEGSTAVQYEPVAGASPAELGTLVDNTADMDDITATLVDLAVRGYIRIEEKTESKFFGMSKSTDYIFHILRGSSEWNDLKPHEKNYLEALLNAAPDDENSVKVSDLKDKFYKSLPKIRNAIYTRLVFNGYYQKRPDKVKELWIGLAVVVAVLGFGLFAISMKMTWVLFSPVALIFAAIASTIIMFVFAVIMPARTEAGARAREAALGFKEFLSRVESERYRKMITSPQMFERYLPFAMAFGVGDEWAKAFEDIYREPPTWYVGHNGHFSAMNFSHSISEMSSAASSSMSSSPSSSGSGGGGSSGGGGGGGGGGGF